MQETKITKRRISNHFTYSWWKYVLLAVVAVFGWNIIYTTSAYKAPRDKRLDVFFVTHGIADSETVWFAEEILRGFPEVEDSNVQSITYTADDNYYGSIQLMTYAGAGEGDVMVVVRDRFEALGEAGTFVPLDDAIASGKLALTEEQIAKGTLTTEDGITGVYGVPLDSLYGLLEHGIDNRGLYACVTAYSPNTDEAMDWINWLIDTMTAPKPEALIQMENEAAEAGLEGTSEISSY